jgi:transcriptional regulator with PAS, ATPase and Fis domain
MTLKQQVVETRRRAIEQALQKHSGNVGRAARDLGIHRAGLCYWLNELGIDPSAYAPDPEAAH